MNHPKMADSSSPGVPVVYHRNFLQCLRLNRTSLALLETSRKLFEGS